MTQGTKINFQKEMVFEMVLEKWIHSFNNQKIHHIAGLVIHSFHKFKYFRHIY